MHYYTLRRDERYAGDVWLRLDSLLAERGEETKNRKLTTDELWALYQSSSHFFGAWALRWYPVVYCKGAAEEVSRQLSCSLTATGSHCSEACALRALKECGWVVDQTLKHFLEDLPRTTVRELLVRFARPSEAEMRDALEEANWDVAAAQPTIDRVLRERISLAQTVEAGAGATATTALSLSDWDPQQAAMLLSFHLQCISRAQKQGTKTTSLALSELHSALQMTGNDLDRAESLLSLVPSVGSMSHAAKLLEQTKTVKAAQRVLEVQKRFPRVNVIVAMEVLRRNDDDPHAACEMLAEYQKAVQRMVLDNCSEELLKDEELIIADTALNHSDWDPNVSFINAKNLTTAVEKTRKIIRVRGGAPQAQSFPIDAVLAALTAAEQNPQSAAAFLLGHEPERLRTSQARPGGPQPHRVVQQDKRKQMVEPEEEETCGVM